MVSHLRTVFISGGSASGKTWLADRLSAELGACTRLTQDQFYRDRPDGGAHDRHEFNFDLPAAIHWAEMDDALAAIRQGETVKIPVYDFSRSVRDGYETLTPKGDVLIVDGTLVLHEARIRRHADVSIYVRCPECLRRSRREDRDVRERGRALEKVRKRLAEHVFPAHDRFVAPSSAHADLILDAEDVLADPERALSRIRALHAASA